MISELKNIKVTILGKNYNLSTDDAEQDILKIARLVDTRAKEIAATLPSKDAYTAVVLLALELAGELKRQEMNLSLWQQKAADLGSLLASKII